jgi:hypothetical protein
MSWSLANFRSRRPGETVGFVDAVYNQGQSDEFLFPGSVNLDIQSTIDGLIQQAESARQKQLTDNSGLIDTINNNLAQG